MNVTLTSLLRLLIGVLAALVSIGAGLYLLGSESAAAEATVFDSLMHGIGAYFIARGAWMLYTLRGVTAYRPTNT